MIPVVFPMILAFLNADTVVFIMMLVFMTADTFVFSLISFVFVMILAFSIADTNLYYASRCFCRDSGSHSVLFFTADSGFMECSCFSGLW